MAPRGKAVEIPKAPESGPGTALQSTAAAAPVATSGQGIDPKRLERIRVKATQDGYYQHKYRREGDVFLLVPLHGFVRDKKTGQLVIDEKTRRPIPRIITAREQYSYKWMEPADDDEPLRLTTSKQALERAHDEIMQGRYGDKFAAVDGLDDDNGVDDGIPRSIDTDDEGAVKQADLI